MNQLAVITPDDVGKIVNESSGQYVSTLSQYKWDLLPDSQLQAAKAALSKSDYIMKIAAQSPGSVHSSLVQSAVLGLDLTEGKRQGWLLPRKNQQGKTVIQLQVGYKGVEAIHQRMGVIDRLVIRAIREKDTFEWSGNDQEKPKHVAEWLHSDEQRGVIKGAFAITYYPDESINVTVASISEIYEKHRDRSDSYKSYMKKKNAGEKAFPPPWITDEKSMVEKTMAYIASKQWPANIRNSEASSKILETLHSIDVSDYSLAYNEEHKKAFQDIVNADDALGYYLLSKRLDIEIFSALHGDFVRLIPKGDGRMKEKARLNAMRVTGEQILHNVYNALSDNDEGLLFESVDGILVITEKMLKATFSDEQAKIYKELMVEEEKTESEKPVSMLRKWFKKGANK